MAANKKYLIGRILVPVLIIILWHILYTIIREPGMASVGQTLNALFTRWQSWTGDIGLSLTILLVSFVSAALAGVILGFVIGLSAFWTETLTPLILAVYSIPKITLYPVFLVLLGISFQSKAAFSFFHGFFPVLIVCMEATRMVPDIYLKISKSYRMSFYQKARYILIPSIVPQLVIGLRLAFSLCFIGLILAEMFSSYKGIGTMLLHYSGTFDIPAVFALFLIIVLIALIATFIFVVLQEKRENKIGKTQQLSL